jgi:hypothetical protein
MLLAAATVGAALRRRRALPLRWASATGCAQGPAGDELPRVTCACIV